MVAWIGKHGVLLAIVSILLLAAAVLYQGLDSNVATLLGAALGAMISVGAAAAVAESQQRRDASAVIDHCAKAAEDMKEYVDSIKTIFDAFDNDNAGITDEDKGRIDDARSRFSERSIPARNRIKRVEQFFVKLPPRDLDAVLLLETTFADVQKTIGHEFEWRRVGSLAKVAWAPLPKAAAELREHSKVLGRIARRLRLGIDD